MQDGKLHLLGIYLLGFMMVFVQVLLFSLLLVWTMQAIAMSHGMTYDWYAIFKHVTLSLTFLVLFPGQTLWTFRITTWSGQTYTIVGDPNIEDPPA